MDRNNHYFSRDVILEWRSRDAAQMSPRLQPFPGLFAQDVAASNTGYQIGPIRIMLTSAAPDWLRTDPGGSHWSTAKLPRNRANRETNRILHEENFLRKLFSRMAGGRFLPTACGYWIEGVFIGSMTFHFQGVKTLTSLVGK